MFQRLPLIAAGTVAVICAAEALGGVSSAWGLAGAPRLSGVTVALLGLAAITLVMSWTRRRPRACPSQPPWH